MRLVYGTIALGLALSWAAPASTLAGTSDRDKLAKAVGKVAISSTTVFTPQFRPKATCYCRTDVQRRVGFLVTGDGTTVVCGVPTTVTLEGMFLVVDYGCQDFEVLGK
jgi:hypothetical protein